MNYIFESIFIGIYSVVIYLFFHKFIKNFYILLLVCGFFKHMLGFFFKIHTYYCNYGEACIKEHTNKNTNIKYYANALYLFNDSIFEALAYLILGTLLKMLVTTNMLYIFFYTGIILHILSELFQIHKSFCIKSCDKNITN